jgi:hypothetical protein
MANALAHREEFATIAALSQPLHDWIESIQEEILSFFSLQALQKIIQDEEVVGSWEFKAELIFFKNHIFLKDDSPLTKDIIRLFCAYQIGLLLEEIATSA